MKIFITGCHGFIGTYIRRNTQFHRDNFIFGSTSSNSDGCTKFKSLYSNANNFINDSLYAIVHCAALIPSTFTSSYYEDCFLPNIQMMNNLCNLAEQKKAKKFIYLSGFGSMEYPESLDVKDYYTLSKITGELFCNMLESRGVQCASLRVSAPFGEWQKQRTVLRIFIEKALKNEPLIVYGTGSRQQNFTYVGDVLQAIEAALNTSYISGIYNIVGRQSISMLDLANLIINITNSNSEIICGSQPDPQENYRPVYSYEKAANEFSYSPAPLKDSLRKYIEWIKFGAVNYKS